MEIKKCLLYDSDEILELYEAARNLQIDRKMVVWPAFEKSFIDKEIKDERQWKITLNDLIACNWAITFQDKEIWGEKDQNNSIYIHRLCNNPSYRGNKYIHIVVEWAKLYAKSLGKQYVRLDTLGNNVKLIEHYTSSGFEFLGIFQLTDTATLPKHYQDEPNCCLFEIDLFANNKK